MKKRAYILVFSAKRDPDEVKDFLNSRSDIQHSVYLFPTRIFSLLSTATADELSKAYHTYFDTGPQRVFIAHIDHDRQGWMPERGWDLFNGVDSEDDERSWESARHSTCRRHILTSTDPTGR